MIRPKRRDAFTLLELLLVLGLLVLMASTSLPAVRSWQLRLEVDRARSAIVELIGEGARRATREGNDWEICLEKSPPALVLKQSRIDRTAPSGIEPRDRRILPRSVQLEFYHIMSDRALNSITVNPLGQVSLARIWFIQNGQRGQAYAIDRLTSTIRPIRSLP